MFDSHMPVTRRVGKDLRWKGCQARARDSSCWKDLRWDRRSICFQAPDFSDINRLVQSAVILHVYFTLFAFFHVWLSLCIICILLSTILPLLGSHRLDFFPVFPRQTVVRSRALSSLSKTCSLDHSPRPPTAHLLLTASPTLHFHRPRSPLFVGKLHRLSNYHPSSVPLIFARPQAIFNLYRIYSGPQSQPLSCPSPPRGSQTLHPRPAQLYVHV